MQAINAEYAAFLASHSKKSEYTRQARAHTEGKKTAADYHDLEEVAEVLRVKIEMALNLSGVEVELCGLWVWLTGNTRAHKDTIKAAGFKWAPDKEAWFFPGVPSFNRQKRTLEEIREMHGSKHFASRQEDDPKTNPHLLPA